MAFSDVAKRMDKNHGGRVGKALELTDPDQIIAEARKSDRRAQVRSDLILGPILLVGGIGVTALSYMAAAGGGVYVVTTGAIVVVGGKLGRGLLGLIRRR